jgi:hypothetical protein
MATKKILLSNGNTKYKESGSVTVEDTTGAVTVNSLQTTSLTLASLNGILSSSNGIISSYTTTVTSGSIISSNGTSWGVVPSGTLYGDLSGTLSSPIVKSISNVTTGILGVARGGTGVTSPTANRILFGNGTSAITTSSAPSTNDVLKYSVSSSAWVLGTYPPNTASFYYQFLTASGNASIPDWATHARFIIQAAGGGGGGGAGKSATNTGAGGGGGGGAGGLTDITIKVGQNFKYYDVSVTIGAGGTGALSRTAAANANGLTGNAGGDTYIQLISDNGSFSYFYRAIGGSAGGAAVSTGGVGGTGGSGGKGLTADGATGGTGSTLGVANSNMSGSSVGYGAGGGGGGGGNTTGAARSATGPGGDGGVTTGVISTTAGNSAAAASAANGTDSTAQLRTYGLTTGTVTPAGITLTLNAAGGAGGTASTTTATAGGRGGNGTRGSGGGGGGPSVGTITGSAPQNGGNGGDGYVLMICW